MRKKKEKIKHPLVLNTYQDGMQGNNIIYEHKEITTRFVNKQKLKCKELRIKIRFKLSKSKGTPYIECTAIKYFPEGISAIMFKIVSILNRKTELKGEERKLIRQGKPK